MRPPSLFHLTRMLSCPRYNKQGRNTLWKNKDNTLYYFVFVLSKYVSFFLRYFFAFYPAGGHFWSGCPRYCFEQLLMFSVMVDNFCCRYCCLPPWVCRHRCCLRHWWSHAQGGSTVYAIKDSACHEAGTAVCAYLNSCTCDADE